jgi:hypothetical protein
MAANLAKLENLRLRDTWQQLLRIDDGDGIDATLEKVIDGNSGECPLYLSDTKVQIKPTTDAADTFEIVDADDTACLTVNTSYNSVSVGHTNSIIGNNTLVVGNGITALGGADNSLVVGEGAECWGSNSIVVGEGAKSYLSIDAVVLGKNAYTRGIGSVAIGTRCIAGSSSGGENVAIGYQNTSEAYFSMTFGNDNLSTVPHAMAIGSHCQAIHTNAIAIGSWTIASGHGSLAMGYQTEASSTYSFAIGSEVISSSHKSFAFGDNTEASGSWSQAFGHKTVAAKSYSRADGMYSKTSGNAQLSRADGSKAHADKWGQRAWQTISLGSSVDYGTAQESRYMLHARTTDATLTEMYLDGAAGQYRLTIESDSTWLFHIRIVARQTNADDVSAGYELKGVIDNNAGTVALASSLTKVEVGEDVAGWDVTAVADNTNDALVVKVTGAVGDTVNWVGFVNTVETIG